MGRRGSYTIYFYELHLPATWEIDSVTNLAQPLVWDIGEFDLDGLYDIVMQSSWGAPVVGITVFESPDSFSYPTQEVWRDTVDIGTVRSICSYDIDRDGVVEILQTGGELGSNYYIDFSIYESIGDNTYAIKYFFESPKAPTSTIAFGDFDTDGFIEFVMGTIDGYYSIFESPDNDSYVPLFVNLQIPIRSGIKDCFTVPDADGDGKLEFVLKGHVLSIANVNTYIFEAVGDNTYQIIKSFILPGGSYDYYGGYSDAGDVDGDSIPEIVLEACQNVYIIKAAGNDSFYIWDTLPGHITGSNVRVTNDIDGNGLNEIVISGNNQTRNYEYEPGGVEEDKFHELPLHTQFGTIAPNPFSGAVRISYQVAHAGGVEIGVYDAAGRLG